jgi:hypothetical protein
VYVEYPCTFENRVLRNIFGPEREEDGSCRKLHNDELHNLYSSPNIVRVIKSRRMRWAGHVTRMGEGRGVYRVLIGRPEGKRPLGRPRRRWEDNIKMDLKEIRALCLRCLYNILEVVSSSVFRLVVILTYSFYCFYFQYW